GAQPSLITQQPIGNDGEAEPRDDPEDGVGGGGAKSRHEACEFSLEDGPANAHDPHRTDRNGDDDADHDAFQEKHQKHPDGTQGGGAGAVSGNRLGGATRNAAGARMEGPRYAGGRIMSNELRRG